MVTRKEYEETYKLKWKDISILDSIDDRNIDSSTVCCVKPYKKSQFESDFLSELNTKNGKFCCIDRDYLIMNSAKTDYSVYDGFEAECLYRVLIAFKDVCDVYIIDYDDMDDDG